MNLQDVVTQRWHEAWHEQAEQSFKTLFGSGGGRYPSSAEKGIQIRAPRLAEDGAPFAALIHPNNQSSGGYAGMSFVIFPSPNSAPAMIAMVVGTLGLGEDAAALGRPGHARRVSALARWINTEFGNGQQIAWAKSDPSNIESDIPETVRRQWSDFQPALKKYGKVIYALAVPPAENPTALHAALYGFLDIAIEERGFDTLQPFKSEKAGLESSYLNVLTPDVTRDEVFTLLGHRRYAIIEGPPGTGKTRLASELIRESYNGRGMTVQFHPGTTYENFVGGLAPVTGASEVGLKFEPRPGYLMTAVDEALACAPEPFLLHLDEVNRADLAKVLGEAIYLFEPLAEPRTVQLPFEFERRGGQTSLLTIPPNLHVLGTMNSADRSIAILDVAIRRRFAFLQLWPQRRVVEVLSGPLMVEAFDRLAAIFMDWAIEDTFALMPGHSYFLDDSESRAPETLRQNLVPLLEEYLAQGYLPGFAEQIRAYIQWIESLR